MQAPPLIAEFIGHPREHAWDRAYADVKYLVETVRAVSIVEAADSKVGPTVSEDARVAVLFHALRAHELMHRSVRERLDEVCGRQKGDGTLALGLAPVGKHSTAAAEAVFAQVGNAPLGQQRWIEGAEDVDQLRGLLTEWLITLIDLHIPGTHRSTESEAVLAAEMPSTPAGTSQSKLRRLRGAI